MRPGTAFRTTHVALRTTALGFAKSLSAAIVLCLMVAPSCCAVMYSVTDIGDFTPSAINYAGQIVGTVSSGTATRAVMWDPEHGLRDLGVVVVSYLSISINNAGQVAGSAQLGSVPRAFRWTAEGGVADLGVLTGDEMSEAFSIDADGNVYGTSVSASDRVEQVFRWSPDSGMTVLGLPPGSGPNAANDSGQIAGSYWTGTEYHAFFWDPVSGFVDLGTLGGQSSHAYDINSLGQVMGKSTSAGGDLFTFVWDSANGMRQVPFAASTMNDMGQFPGKTSMWVGDHYEYRAVIWEEGSDRVDLPLPNGKPILGLNNTVMNDRGQVVGRCSLGDGVYRAVLWTPVPEPSSLVALLVSIVGTGFIRRRR